MHDIEKRHNRNRDIGMIEDVDDGDFERWDAGVPAFFHRTSVGTLVPFDL